MARVPGWYPHPDQQQMLRWWDGTAWTGHIAAEPPAGSPPPPPPGGLSWPSADVQDAVPPPPPGVAPPPPHVPVPPPAPPGPPAPAPARAGRIVGTSLAVVVGLGVAVAMIAGGRGNDENTPKDALRHIAAAQELHHTTRGTYARSLSALGVTVDDDVEAFVVTATDRAFCAEASLRSSTRVWRYDTRFNSVEEGRCPV